MILYSTGVKMQKETLKHTGFRLGLEQREKIKKLAKKNKCTKSEVVRYIIDQYEEKK